MNYLILAETEFFALINGAGNGNNMEAAYNGFVESVISLCYGNGNSADAAIAMAYAENELLQYHTLYDDSVICVNLFVRIALSFIRKMQILAAAEHIQVPPPITRPKTRPRPCNGRAMPSTSWNLSTASMKWAVSTTVKCRSNSLPRSCTGYSASKPKTATVSTSTSNAGRTKAALISLTGCRRNSTERFCVTRSWNG